MKDTWTAFVTWPDNPAFDGWTEEVDVEANHYAEARDLAAAALTAGYEPGWKIIDLVCRIPGYITY